VVIVRRGVVAQMRHGDRNGREAVILEGKARGTKKLGRCTKPLCSRRRNIAELQFDQVNLVDRFVRPQRQHEASRARQAAPDLG
jgi:hypothetical protein